MSQVEHDRSQLGAFALGALDPDEERAVHAHVSTCPECQRELADFVSLRQALDQVPPEAFLDGPPNGGDLLLRETLRQVRAAAPEHARRRWSPALVAAAVVALVAVTLGGGVLIGRATAPDTVVADSLPDGSLLAEATDPATGASATVAVEPRAGWVWVTADIAGVPAGEKCEMVVTADNGDEFVAGSWLVSEQGAARGLELEGAALVAPDDVASVSIRTLDGRTMVTIPV